MLKKAARYFGRLKGNARVCVACHPLWGIPFSFYYYYLSLYLKESGVTDGQLGGLMVAGTVASLLFSLVAAPIVDRMGRKRSTLVFDLLSSALPPLLYFISGSFAMALLATVLYNSNKIMSVGYYLTLIEDADDDERVVALNLFNLITYAAGILIPVAGLFVARYGVTATEKVFLLSSAVLMGGMIVARDRLLKETRMGGELMARAKAEGRRMSFSALAAPYRESLRFMRKNPVALLGVLANVFFFVYMSLGTNQSLYFTPYFIDALGLTSAEASALGGLYSAGMLAAMALINPRLRRENLLKGLAVGCILTVAGLLLMVWVPKGSMAMAVVAVLAVSVSYGMLKTGVDGVMAVYSQGEARSGLYSLCNLVSAVIGAAATFLVARWYSRFAGTLYLVCALMGVCMLACALLAARAERKITKEEGELHAL